MTDNLFWSFFESTGDIYFYVKYKEAKRREKGDAPLASENEEPKAAQDTSAL